MIENASLLLNNELESWILIALLATLAGAPLIGAFHRIAIAWAALADKSRSEHSIGTEGTLLSTSMT